jgi:hypothetical protein
MSKIKLCVLCALLWQLPFPAFALDTLSLLSPGTAKQLLENEKAIHATASGEVPVSFTQALDVLKQPDFMNSVQKAYVEKVIDDEKPEFSIIQTSTNAYHYVNRKGERTDVVELMRRQTRGDSFDIILYSWGKRSFGKYQAVIHVQVLADGKGQCRYDSSVYAYPENVVSRFFARHLGLVERYFTKKTKHLSEMIAVIACRLCGNTEPVLQAGSSRSQGRSVATVGS